MGTWPGNPPAGYPANVQPGDFDPEPNWRSMYEAAQCEITALKHKLYYVEKERDDLLDEIKVLGERD